jgi:hypothetical protein
MARRYLTPLLTLTGAALVLAACGTTAREAGSPPASTPTSTTASTSSEAEIESSEGEDVPSGLVWALGGPRAGLPDPAVPLAELRSGGPPPDGIPPIDDPQFLPARDVDFLADNEPVLAVDIDGEARAYPVQVLIWHEIVNDTVAGIPVAVTYCPLCNSAVAYDRRVGERVLTFGTSGMLWNLALVMYDRQTETLWSHFTGRGIVGVLTATELDTFPVATVPWRAWRDAHPDGLVLSRDTGHTRDYGRNPYPGYDDVTSQPFLFEGEVDGRYTAMTRVVGIVRGSDALAVPLTDLRDARVVAVEAAGEPLVVWWTPGTASALDAADVAAGDDVGASGAFESTVDGQTLTFRATGDGFTDDATGSTWDLFGNAVDGPLAGRRLQAVERVDTFWFAWSAFQPDTRVVAASR